MNTVALIVLAVVCLVGGGTLFVKTISPNTNEFPMTRMAWAGQVVGGAVFFIGVLLATWMLGG